MATTNEYFKGKVRYCYTNKVDNYGNWSLKLYLDSESKDKIIELQTKGLKNTLKKDDDGYYVTFKRPPKKEYKDYVTGAMKEMTFQPPVIFDVAGNVLPNAATIIGDGSDITIKCQVYPFGGKGGIAKGIATRLESVRIDNLVPYTNRNLNPDDERQSKGLMGQPEHTF